MEKENVKPMIEEIKESLLRYAIIRMRLIKLSVYEKTAVILSSISYFIVVLCVGVISLFFLFMMMAIWIGNMCESVVAGYAIMCIISASMLLPLYIYREKLKRWFKRIFISSVYEESDLQ